VNELVHDSPSIVVVSIYPPPPCPCAAKKPSRAWETCQRATFGGRASGEGVANRSRVTRLLLRKIFPWVGGIE
jgi:hypothetical protein